MSPDHFLVSSCEHKNQKTDHMELDFANMNWLAILVCLVIGQVFLTLWFVVLFGAPWAREYGAKSQKEHTQAVPGYTYGVQAVSTAILIIGLALLQNALNITTMGEGLLLGIEVAIFYALATSLPGYAFLKRYRAFFLAMGSQTVLILIVSSILALWK